LLGHKFSGHSTGGLFQSKAVNDSRIPSQVSVCFQECSALLCHKNLLTNSRGSWKERFANIFLRRPGTVLLAPDRYQTLIAGRNKQSHCFQLPIGRVLHQMCDACNGSRSICGSMLASHETDIQPKARWTASKLGIFSTSPYARYFTEARSPVMQQRKQDDT
jgi:hypothetical protein